MVTATIVSIGHYEPKNEAIEAYIARLKAWLRANNIAADKKVDSTLSMIGPDAFTVLLNTCHPADPSTKSLDDLEKILTKHYHAPKNKFLERKTFRERCQKDNESVSEFALELKRLSITCEFGDTLEDNLLERFMNGVKSTPIRNKLYNTKELTWTTAQAEALAMEQNREQGSSGDINQVRRGGYRRGWSGSSRGRRFVPRTSETVRNETVKSDDCCERCLSTEHSSEDCPFKRATCYSCNRKGHVKTACRNQPRRSQPSSRGRGRGKASRGKQSTKNVHQVEGPEDFDDDSGYANLFHIRAIQGETKSEFEVHVLVENINVTFAVDTQAAVSVISEDLYYKHFQSCKLEPVRYKLKSYSGHEIPVVGCIKVKVEYDGQKANVSLVVVKGVKESLLGRDWLKVITLDWKRLFQTVSVPKMNNSIEDVVRKYGEVFEHKSQHHVIGRFEANVQLKPEAQPVFRKARPVPYSLRDAVEKSLDKAVQEGIMIPVGVSKWASPIVVAPKANGSIRVCGDYKRTVNLQVDDQIYPLPTAQDIFSTLAGGKIFSTIDLSNAYQQVKLTQAARELLTINTHKGLYQYTRLPYGVKVAPAIFQSIMDQILSGLSGVCCYLDDILLTSKSLEEHVILLDTVLARLKEYGVLANRDKCKLGINSVNYLGHVIDESGIRPSPEKVKAIEAVPEPTSVTELRTFLGAVTFYHKFLNNFASVCAPLYALTRKDAKWIWSKKCKLAFQQVKTMLASDLLLTHYDVTMPLKLSTDASPFGVAAVLSHVIDGFEKPIAYASRTLSPAEKNYSQLEREALAIMFGIKRFHKFVYGRKFVLVTDNKPLAVIFNPSKDIPTLSALRLQRWALVLMGHDYTIEYRKSADHGNVDMLSRFPDGRVPNETLELPINHFSYVDDLPVTSSDVRRETASDKVLTKVLRYVMFGWPSSVEEELLPYFRRRNELSVDQGCLLWGMRVVIPKKLQNQVLQDVHHDHTGIVRMKMLARSYYWFPEVDQQLENIAKSCEACQVHAKSPVMAPTVSWPKCTVPWERVHVDFGTIENKDLLILVDVFSKWIEVEVMTTTTASRVIEVLRQWWARFGIPQELVSDNGPQFIAAEFEEFLRRNGVKHTLSPPYSPRTNGSAERSVQVVKSILKKQLVDEANQSKVRRTFQQKLDDFLITYRSTPSTVTGVTPAELVLGRKLRTRLSFLRPEEKVKVKDINDHVREFSDGDLVWVKNFVGRIKWSPGQIIRREGLLKYYVHLEDKQTSRLVHIDHLTRRVKSDVVNCDNVTPNYDMTIDNGLQNSEVCGSSGVNTSQGANNGQSVNNDTVVVPQVPVVPEVPPVLSEVPRSRDGPVVPGVASAEPRRNPTRERRVPQRLIENC